MERTLAKLKDLEEQYGLVCKKIQDLRKERILQPQPDERLRLEKRIAESEEEHTLLEQQISALERKISEPTHLFEQSDTPEFAGYFERLARKANRIVLIGMGLNILSRDPFRKNLIDRAVKGECELEIYLANPFSPAIETRLIEEEMREKPLIGKSGIITRIKTIIEEYDEKKTENAPKLTFKAFSNYLTLALLIADDEYCFYPYGFARLGNDSPVAHYSKSNPAHYYIIDFLEEQHKRIKEAAIDARLIYDLLYNKNNITPERLSPFAVYLVPEATSKLYEFGSQVLGYDIRKPENLKVSPWADYVGEAANFGFHVTVADALYFAHQSEIELVSKEIEILAQGFAPFQLNFKIQPGFPNERGIALICQDDSGTLEALHHELVFRCYRRAVASNYSLKLANPNRDQNLVRAELMIERYHAPYILNRFRPHFTLLTEVPPEKMEQITREIQKAFEQQQVPTQIKVKRLALMRRYQMDQPWKIAQEIELGR